MNQMQKPEPSWKQDTTKEAAPLYVWVLMFVLLFVAAAAAMAIASLKAGR